MLRNLRNIKSFLTLYSKLIMFDRELSQLGFSNVFKKYSIQYQNKNSNLHTSHEAIEEIKNLFDLLDVVCTWYPRKADCIHKTLMGYRILHEKYSLNVEMVVGVKKFPFQAHAWLKVNNEDLFDEGEEILKYKIFLNSNKYTEDE